MKTNEFAPNRNLLNSIFAHDALIVNAGLPEQWAGSARIKDRYTKLFGNANFNSLSHTGKQITVRGNSATVIADTTGEFEQEGKGVVIWSNGGEKWTLKKEEDGWKVVRFIYGL